MGQGKRQSYKSQIMKIDQEIESVYKSNFNFESIKIPRFLIVWQYGIDILLNEREGRVKELLLVMI